jgi:hypothetical protein
MEGGMGVDGEVEHEAASFCRRRQDPVIRASSIIDPDFTTEVHSPPPRLRPHTHHVCPAPNNSSEIPRSRLATVLREGCRARLPHLRHERARTSSEHQGCARRPPQGRLDPDPRGERCRGNKAPARLQCCSRLSDIVGAQ